MYFLGGGVLKGYYGLFMVPYLSCRNNSSHSPRCREGAITCALRVCDAQFSFNLEEPIIPPSLPPPCVFNIYARNPTLDKSDIEKYLRDYLGVELVLWLGQGVVGDVDTDGHIDNLLAFVRPGEVSYQQVWILMARYWLVSAFAQHRLKGRAEGKGIVVSDSSPGMLFQCMQAADSPYPSS